MTPHAIDIDVFRSLRGALAFSSLDYLQRPADAWIYGVIVGWGDALPEVAARHDWTGEAVVRLRTLRAVFELVEEKARLDWSMMAEAICRAGLPATTIRAPNGTVNNCSLAVGDNERECQICGGACPDKARYER